MNRAVLNSAVLGCANISVADVGGVGVMGAYDEGKVKPYIAGHVTDGSSTFTFKVNNQNVTVPVDANGNWKWVADRTITSFYRAFYNKTNIDSVLLRNVAVSGSCEGMFQSCTSLEQITLDNSLSGVTSLYSFANGNNQKDIVIIGTSFDAVTTCNQAFVYSNSIEGLQTTSFANCNNMYRMFLGYKGTTLDLSAMEIKTGTNVQAFLGDPSGNLNLPLQNLLIKKIEVTLSFSACSKLTEQSVVNIFNAVAADGITLTFHQNVWNMIMREVDVQGSPINVAYQNMINNYDVTVANVSFDAEIEYLGFSGTQYVDTGFKGNTTTTRAETELQVTDFSATCGLFGSRNSSTSTNTDSCNVFVLDNNRFSLDWVNGTTKVIATNIVTTEKYIISITRGMATVNDVTFTGTNIDSIDQNYNFYIGTYNRAGETSPNLFRGRFYWFKIYSNNQLVRDFIPVRKGTTGYLYDKVSGNLFGNSGTGDFILGNDK